MKKAYIAALSLLLPCTIITMKEKGKRNLIAFSGTFPFREKTLCNYLEENFKYGNNEVGFLVGTFKNGTKLEMEIRLTIKTTEHLYITKNTHEGPLSEKKKKKLNNLMNNNQDVQEAMKMSKLLETRVTVVKGMAAKTKLGKDLQKDSHYKDTVIITQRETKK